MTLFGAAIDGVPLRSGSVSFSKFLVVAIEKHDVALAINYVANARSNASGWMGMTGDTSILDKPTDLLQSAYEHLAFDQGALLSATFQPQPEDLAAWLDYGDWQSLAAQVGAEKIFFVDRDPVVIFAKLEQDSPEVLRKLYEQIWCMSRPQLLFLACPGELVVYDLTKPPPKATEALDSNNRLISVAKSVVEVNSKLAAFHRERIETGAIFGDERFGNSANRADRALIRDLQTVRRQLAAVAAENPPEIRHLHSLIGRAIFVRYLEDRNILVPSYFEGVAASNKSWQKLLAQAPIGPSIESRMTDLRFLRVLKDKKFTYALFRQLAEDFNGDIFPIEAGEIDCIQQQHLDKLRGFLLGNTTDQQEIFFFAYRFDVIPIELISTIYEEFYNERIGKSLNKGSHYTPSALVEFILTRTLTPEILAQKPRVFDPACGSGIFLVESFRRMVRHLWREQNGKRVSRPQLRRILRDQIAGIDINEEAVRVAAFSLYLAYLHYQDPREINDERRLPYLKWVSDIERVHREKQKPGSQFFDVLLHANAFEVIANELPQGVIRRFGQGSANIVVGNPPWGYPKKEDVDGQAALKRTLKWCNSKDGRPIGDNELSQAFIHLTLALLKDGGRAGLLVSSGVLFKHHDKSRAFRKVWLKQAKLEHVVNFAHVRSIFFSGPQRKAQGISPFISVVFERTTNGPPSDNTFQYWSAKRTAVIENTKCVILNRGDMHVLSQHDCIKDESLWKIYWWGGHRDEALINRLSRLAILINLPSVLPKTAIVVGQGFKEANKSLPADWLRKYRELPIHRFNRYGMPEKDDFSNVPMHVEARGAEEVYDGHRILIGRGIKAPGIITARLETQKYAFRNSIHGVRMKEFKPWQEATLIGIFWSSLARYFYFVTSGSWVWHDEIHLEDVKRMPICFPEDKHLRNRILDVVNELRKSTVISADEGLFQNISTNAHTKSAEQIQELEKDLDSAIFDLYGLTHAEREVVLDMCSMGLDLFYEHKNGLALSKVDLPEQEYGTFSQVSNANAGLAAYLQTFLGIWNQELAPDGEFEWRILSPSTNAPLIAVSFVTRYKNGSPPSELTGQQSLTWSSLLRELDTYSVNPDCVSRIFVESFFRYVDDQQILFIKRNERRFWTRTAAREDAESALTHLMTVENLNVERQS